MTSKRKMEIRKAAQNLFRNNGYMATTMRDIAKEVGIQAPSLYNHFRKKEEILANICFDMATQFFTAVEGVKKKELKPTAMLSQAIKEHVFVIIKNLDASAVFLHEWKSLDEKNLAEFKNLRKQYEAEFHKIILAGIEANEFKKVDEHFYCLALFSSMNWLYDLYRPDGKLPPHKIAHEFVHLLLDGLKA